jgi:hypothetical protein
MGICQAALIIFRAALGLQFSRMVQDSIPEMIHRMGQIQEVVAESRYGCNWH